MTNEAKKDDASTVLADPVDVLVMCCASCFYSCEHRDLRDGLLFCYWDDLCYPNNHNCDKYRENDSDHKNCNDNDVNRWKLSLGT